MERSLQALISEAAIAVDELRKATLELSQTGQVSKRIDGILQDLRLSGPGKLILIALAHFSTPLRQVDLIRYTSLDAKTVRRHIPGLLLAGLVRAAKDGGIIYYAAA